MNVAIEEPGRQIFYPALNMSASGIYLQTAEPPAVGLHVRVVLSLPPDGVFVTVPGHVVRRASPREPSGFAVAFDWPDERTTSTLRRFVSTRAASHG